MRLIDADALFAEFENVGWYNNADRDEIAERLVLQAPTIDAVSVEWISCDERSPSENGYYLCCNKGYLPYVGHYQNGRWIDFDCTILHADAWMPLPQPYGERKESE